MNQSDFGQLLIFHTIVKENSISGSAKKLGIATPSVSKSLKNLEQKIGSPLFLRSTRKLQLTETGLALFEQTTPAIATLDTAWQSLSELAKQPSGTVRITLSQVHFELIFKPIYAKFCAMYPDILLEFSINNALVDLIDDGFDLGVRMGGTLTDNVVAKPVYPSMKQGFYISKNYAKTHGIPTTPNDLTAHRLISLRFMSSQKLEPLFVHIDGENVLQMQDSALIFNNANEIIDATVQGLGMGRIFEPLAQKWVESGELIPILQPFWVTFPPSFVYYLPNKNKAKRVQVLLDFLTNHNI